ncbi:hypothetical protein CEE37_05765 [candidate division LCP-89 bacterium B3_LCP]|uniref:Primase C-terminal 1 domain-containing protein n=1 Tax=candidate division LCP-89 bacterium B3_LCP TaxID=2012998 RepID=A0A532V1S5_UNCL8|nr:MAG: hypothetical protein CEE37_05765 [candidate division LCP-89 bacterium B3_LCP]
MGGRSRRRQVLTIQEVERIEQEGYDDEAYTSPCIYSTDLVEYVKANKKTAGYKGTGIPRFVHLDFDSPGNLNLVLDHARHLGNFLSVVHYVPVDSLVYYFSGEKGFHVYLPPSIFGGFSPLVNPHILQKNVATRILEDAGLLSNDSTADMGIYKANQILSIPNSWHRKGDHRKIYLNWNQITSLSISQIQRLALDKQPLYPYAFDEFFPVQYLQDITGEAINTTTERSLEVESCVERAEYHDLFEDQACTRRMYEGGLSDRRKRAAHVLASKTFRFLMDKKGMTYTDAVQIVYPQIIVWNNTNSPPLEYVYIQNAIKNAEKYDYGCHHPWVKPFCKEKECSWFRKTQNRRMPSLSECQDPVNRVLNKIPPDQWTEDEVRLKTAALTEFRNSRPETKNTFILELPKGVRRSVRDKAVEKYFKKPDKDAKNSKRYYWR